MFYDLHMHSCLSPCAEDAMTPNNICNMAFIKGLDLIAVTDHNSTKNLPAIAEVAGSIGLKMLYGAELETSEEVHVLGLFSRLEKALKFQEWIDSKMPSVKNDEDYFGHQWIMNSRDEKTGDEERLLLVSLSATLEETAAAIHEYGGRVILAHVLDRANSVTHQLGFIPMDLPYDGLEVKNEEQRLRVIETNPWVTEDSTNWFIDSDAHYLTDISEPDHFLRESVYKKLWGDDV
ncbi:MAG: PHP domain-containing protein [Erysipelotrichaceae bacterium]|nr:PHP domain-containing protein [Erysipelotrichaceae bacterium]